MRTLRPICVLLAAILAAATMRAVTAQQADADVILVNGKVVTVDERFSIAQAVAVRGGRIVAVGRNEDVTRLAGPATRRIDARGRTVLPGLIDNHMHLLRYGTTWKYEVRWDGVDTRKDALARLRVRASSVPAGQWVYILGGWAIEQFSDDARPFSRAELDAVAPNNPVLLQASYYEAYLNSRALETLGIEAAPDQPGVARDASGKPTGRVSEEGFRRLVDKLPVASDAEIEASTFGMIRELNSWGLTSFGSAGCEPPLLERYRGWAAAGRLNLRVFCITTPPGGRDLEQFLAQIPKMTVFQGDSFVDTVAFGENFGALGDPMFRHRTGTRPQDVVEWARIAREVARARLPLHVHTNFEETIDTYLEQIDAINREYPVRNLRWVLAHFNQPTAAQLERMKRLGLYAAVHPWAVINGGINLRQFGAAAYDMAPLATIQRSGITWGFGSDGSRANQVNPFEQLAWAVTGQMVGGTPVLKQTISREDALIAYTRKNAYFIFQEDNLGSLQPGKLADLIVLDRDYLTVPAGEIKDIGPVLTMVNGRIVHDTERR